MLASSIVRFGVSNLPTQQQAFFRQVLGAREISFGAIEFRQSLQGQRQIIFGVRRSRFGKQPESANFQTFVVGLGRGWQSVLIKERVSKANQKRSLDTLRIAKARAHPSE